MKDNELITSSAAKAMKQSVSWLWILSGLKSRPYWQAGPSKLVAFNVVGLNMLRQLLLQHWTKKAKVQTYHHSQASNRLSLSNPFLLGGPVLAPFPCACISIVGSAWPLKHFPLVLPIWLASQEPP